MMLNRNGREDTSEKKGKDLRRIAGLVAGIPDKEPPDTLVESIMTQIRPKRLGLLNRLWCKARTPISFTPLTMVPVGAALAAVLVLAVFLGRAPEREDLPFAAGGAETSKNKVFLTLNMPYASTVDVIGSFNKWTPNGFRMLWDESRKLWVLPLTLEKGRYEYAFLVDGKKVVPDPRALLHQDDGFGNQNSILIVEGDNNNETAI
jgi:hypothetical protein